MTDIEIGKLLRASTASCVLGCRISQATAPNFGDLVRIHVEKEYGIYGLVYDIRIEDDGLVRQLVTAENVSDDVIQDNRRNRSVPVEVSVLHVGYRQSSIVYHLMPPRPPLSLDAIYICGPTEACKFTGHGRFGYFRHILQAADLPIGEMLAAHIKRCNGYHSDAGKINWASEAVKELIVLLRDDYPTLMTVLGAVADTVEW